MACLVSAKSRNATFDTLQQLMVKDYAQVARTGRYVAFCADSGMVTAFGVLLTR